MAKKIVIIGGVAGGATAATRLRRLNEEDEIILLEKGEYISYANCGLPYHVGNVIKEREKLLVQSIEKMHNQYNLDVRNFSEVTKINPEEKEVEILNHKNGESYKESFDYLIISTGAKAIIPPITGLNEAKNAFSLRNIPDMDEIKAYIKEHQVQTATVIGGGFIGLEMMENLAHLGIKVQLVEMSPQVMPNIDFEMAQEVHAQINLQGVDLYLNDGLKEFKDQGRTLLLNSGKELKTEMTILSIGVAPENTLAKESGITLGFKGGIKVDDNFMTNYKDIYAIGDVIEVKDGVDGSPTNIPLAWPANRQGRLVADVINGMEITYPGTKGTSAAKVFALTVAATGNSERILKNKGIPYEVIHVHPNSHAGYYPDASPIHLKLIFGQDGKILGAQGVGVAGVDKRIDVIATAMTFGAKAWDLAGIELAYAPPYSSAKDPVNMLGYVADNMKKDKVETFQWHEVDDLLKEGAYLLDIREEVEYATGKIEGSHYIPLSVLRGHLDEIPKDKTIYVLCQVGLRGYNGARVLLQNGFKAKNLDGGYKTYKIGKYQINNKNIQPTKKEEAVPTRKANVRSIQVDACGLQCPGPILKVKENMDEMNPGDEMVITASDFGFSADIEAWAKNTGNTVLANEVKGNKVVAKLAKGTLEKSQLVLPKEEGVLSETKNGATMIVFSGNLDKAIASMIIASGAAAMGKNVTIFFTFWGLSVLKKKKIKKSGLAKMFDVMLPNSANKLPVSSMNMLGAGRKMIQSVMKNKNVEALPVMIEKAHKLGVKFVACTMSMDIMGIEASELFDFVEYGGVATYLGDTENSNLNLFI
ncbi:MAG TPA: FAD-dependent oxidoreductase [Candidatus Dorea intestinavium]|nr:FAD-dependent oxidoreductase [Candidatus Dorea intestinavium]